MEFDLFSGLESLSKSDYGWYGKLSDEGKKQVAPLVLARWLSGTSDYLQLIKLNMLVNPYTFSLGNEKDLLCKLMAAILHNATSFKVSTLTILVSLLSGVSIKSLTDKLKALITPVEVLTSVLGSL